MRPRARQRCCCLATPVALGASVEARRRLDAATARSPRARSRKAPADPSNLPGKAENTQVVGQLSRCPASSRARSPTWRSTRATRISTRGTIRTARAAARRRRHPRSRRSRGRSTFIPAAGAVLPRRGRPRGLARHARLQGRRPGRQRRDLRVEPHPEPACAPARQDRRRLRPLRRQRPGQSGRRSSRAPATATPTTTRPRRRATSPTPTTPCSCGRTARAPSSSPPTTPSSPTSTSSTSPNPRRPCRSATTTWSSCSRRSSTASRPTAARSSSTTWSSSGSAASRSQGDYWDAGYVQLDVTTRPNPTYVDDTTFASEDPLRPARTHARGQRAPGRVLVRQPVPAGGRRGLRRVPQRRHARPAARPAAAGRPARATPWLASPTCPTRRSTGPRRSSATAATRRRSRPRRRTTASGHRVTSRSSSAARLTRDGMPDLRLRRQVRQRRGRGLGR